MIRYILILDDLLRKKAINAEINKSITIFKGLEYKRNDRMKQMI